MSTYLVELDLSAHKNEKACKKAIEDCGCKVKKTYKFNSTFSVEGNEKDIKKIPGLKHYTNAEADAGAKLQVSSDHLDYTIDITGQTTYYSDYLGEGQTVYLIDTGIDETHVEFEDADIFNLYSNFYDDDSISNYADPAGHGTAVGSLIVGKNLGAAPKAKLKNVKLFDANSGGITVGEIIDCLDAVLTDHLQDSPDHVKVVNMSWVINQNDFIDAKISELDQHNLLVLCAAGNTGEDVNTKSPAGVEQVITVGAFDRNLNVTTFTNAPRGSETTGFVNYGSALDIFAMGVDVTVAVSDDKTLTESTDYEKSTGTSLATGIASGIATHYIEKYPDKSAEEIKEIYLAEGHYLGQQYLVFDESDPAVDYKNVYRSVVTTESKTPELTQMPSGRLCNVKLGENTSVDLGIHPDAVDVALIEFASTPNWIMVNTDTGIVSVDTKGLNPNRAPGIYLFALRGTINNIMLVEEFGVGVFNNDEDELGPETISYYYDADKDEYDEVVNYQVAPSKS